MSNGTNQYQVIGLQIRTAPRLDSQNRAFNATIVTYYIGRHGPFQDVYAPGEATTANVTARITATVNAIKAQDAQIAQLNTGG